MNMKFAIALLSSNNGLSDLQKTTIINADVRCGPSRFSALHESATDPTPWHIPAVLQSTTGYNHQYAALASVGGVFGTPSTATDRASTIGFSLLARFQ